MIDGAYLFASFSPKRLLKVRARKKKKRGGGRGGRWEKKEEYIAKSIGLKVGMGS